MQMMAMGSGEAIQKVIAADPRGVVLSREREKIALQELNDRGRWTTWDCLFVCISSDMRT